MVPRIRPVCDCGGSFRHQLRRHVADELFVLLALIAVASFESQQETVRAVPATNKAESDWFAPSPVEA